VRGVGWLEPGDEDSSGERVNVAVHQHCWIDKIPDGIGSAGRSSVSSVHTE
jgi:hypothetical protein